MITKQIRILFFVTFLIFSCQKEKKEVIDAGNFFNKIDLRTWNNKTNDFIKNECDESLLNLHENDSVKYKYITNSNDTIRTLDEHLKFYLQTRESFLEVLKEEAKKFPRGINTLIISEEYLDINNPKISYTVTTDDPKNSYVFYFKSNSFKNIEALGTAHKEYAYDSIISKKAGCVNQVQGMLNSVNFETVLLLKDSTLSYNLKSGYFGSVTIN